MRENLSTDREAIGIWDLTPTGIPGTVVTARIQDGIHINIQEALAFLSEVVEFVDVPVTFNGELISGNPYESILPSTRSAWREERAGLELAGLVRGDLELMGMATGDLRVVLRNVTGKAISGLPGTLVLLQSAAAIRTFRSGFGLATVGLQSIYRWGGVIDLPFLTPTAGREALEANSNQQLQELVGALDTAVSELATSHAESFGNDLFLQWILQTRQFHLCRQLEVAVRPSGDLVKLEDVVARNGIQYYEGRDPDIISTYASEDEPLILVSPNNPRRSCELGFLQIQEVRRVDESPRVIEEIPPSSYSFDQSALAIRISRIFEEDYFLPVDIQFGSISGNLSVLVTSVDNPVQVFLDPSSTSVAPLLEMYTNDFAAFNPFVKDFVRTTIFPRVSKLVPSSTREGAEAFLRRLRSRRERFEYELDDRADLEEILRRLSEGEISVEEAHDRLTDPTRSVIEVSFLSSASVSSVLPYVESDTAEGSELDPLPGIDRRESSTNARILTSDSPLNGYDCFLALSDRVQQEKGDFFLQPHTTEVVWGGRKVVFVFQHHSLQFGLYYDILCPGLVGTSGGGPQRTSTILTHDRTFIPIPQEIAAQFLPDVGSRMRLEIKCDVLYLESDAGAGLGFQRS